MNITQTDLRIPSADGIHTLSGRVYVPDCPPKGLFHVVHGMTEHIGRYDTFMRAVAADGWIVFGYDNLGHGNTARDERELGFIAEKNGWDILARDVAVAAAYMKEQYGEALPYCLMGHSMGSFIVRAAVERYVTPDRLIVMGTGGPNPAAGAGLALIGLIKLFRGKRVVSPLIDRMAFSKYNERFRDEADGLAWLTKDKAVRDIYRQDTHCTFRFTVCAMGDLIRLNKLTNRRAWFAVMAKKRVSILLVSGSDDPVGDYGRGVTAVYRRLLAAGADVRVKLYDSCRHEVLNDTCRTEVTGDIVAFIQGL